MNRVNARTLKGFRDYLPEAEIPRQRMLRAVTEVFESFGFGPLTTPALEYSEVLLGNYGDEGDKLLYRFEDNGGRDVALRYDLTAPLARVVAQHGNLERPFKRYQIAPVWRAEKPGKGRFREFLQCDVDIVGEASMRADAECMLVGLEVLRALGVDSVEMRVNNRKLLAGILDRVGIATEEKRRDVLRAVDKLPKIGRPGVERELQSEHDLDAQACDRLFEVLGCPVNNREDVQGLEALLSESEEGLAGIAELVELLDHLEAAGVSDSVTVDLSIARGLDYYTGTIYETFVTTHEEYGSVMSGGRYDNLLGTFLKESLPAVGISLGIDRLVSLLSDSGGLPARSAVADVFAALFDDEAFGPACAVASQLRAAGVAVEVSLKAGRLGKQFRYAERKGYRWVLFAGPDEVAVGQIALKDLQDGSQRTLSFSEVVLAIRG
jgi:histidyl-tRNA synthetase